jgi:hypothetical protein
VGFATDRFRRGCDGAIHAALTGGMILSPPFRGNSRA